MSKTVIVMSLYLCLTACVCVYVCGNVYMCVLVFYIVRVCVCVLIMCVNYAYLHGNLINITSGNVETQVV